MFRKYAKQSLIHQFEEIKLNTLKIEFEAKEDNRNFTKEETREIRRNISTMCEIFKTLNS